MHRVATPLRLPVFFSAPISVARMRAPLAPIGCPSAQAPPWMLTRAWDSWCSFIAAMVTTAKASLISQRSTSADFQPALASTALIAWTGAMVNSAGSRAAEACATIRASGVSPRLRAWDSAIITTAAAPSLMELALAAVTVPSFLNAGLSVGIFSGMALNGPSSRLICSTPLRPLISTGTISKSKLPSSLARRARLSDSSANASCCSRVKP
jgi:hypothetical protein